jgi:pyruvate formate lyase activating enzyme
MNACAASALRLKPDGSYPVDRGACKLCGACVCACPSGALRFVGTAYDVEALCKKLLRDEPFYRNSGGGVTFSGGEPTLHSDYVSALAKLLKKNGIHICIETCGLYERRRFEETLLPYIDLICFDIKLYDREKHRRYCGVPNDTIIENFKALCKNGAVALLPRIPLVPGITADEENLKEIRSFLRECDVKELGLLPYNPLWLSKLKSIGVEPEYGFDKWMRAEEKERVKEIFKGFVFRDF